VPKKASSEARPDENSLASAAPQRRRSTQRRSQRASYSSWRRIQTPCSLRPLGARSSHL
jgi:hypothetical protein